MNYFAALFLALVIYFPAQAVSASPDSLGGDTVDTKLRMTFDNHEVIIALFDNPASRDFISLLPLTMDFSDFASTEKVATLPRKLSTQGSPTAREVQGDFSYYAPWGNLAIFYHGTGTDGQLYVLGRISSGKEYLAKMRKPFSATITRTEF